MFFKTLFRCIGVPLTILALALTFAAPATAGGSDGGGSGPSVLLPPPTVALDGQGGVVVTTTLICWDEAVLEDHEAHVELSVPLKQPRAAGFAYIEATCAVEPQVLTLSVSSVTGTPFGPGPVTGMFEFQVYTATMYVQGAGEIDQVLKPVQANR